MAQTHLIGNVTLDFRASRQTDGVALQEEVSRWFWQEVLPELNQTLEAVVGPDVVLRINRIVLELPAVDRLNWKEKLTTSICRMMAEEIIRQRLFPRPTDAGLEEVSPTTNRFDAWLDFIRTGQQRLSVAEPDEWQAIALNLIATSPDALVAFRHLLRTQSTALERLVRQHSEAFLEQLAEAITGHSAQELRRWQSAFRGLFMTTWWQALTENRSVQPEQIDIAFWMLFFEKLSSDTYQSAYTPWINDSGFFYELIERVMERSVNATSLALAIARFFQQQYRQRTDQKSRSPKPEGCKPRVSVFGETQLRLSVQEALYDVSDGERLLPMFESILMENRAAITMYLNDPPVETNVARPMNPLDSPATDLISAETPMEPIIDAVAGKEVFYVNNAGVVLLHPFLSAYFGEVGLQPGKKTDRRRAVQLIQYLATGDTKTHEYDLLLPKVLTGWPINQPIDRVIRLTKAEKDEAQRLLEMVISYWSALGSTSVAGLREGFFQREGRLSKRDNNWLLQVEKQTIDILLDQLPWGFGVIKTDWMTEFLYVEWF